MADYDQEFDCRTALGEALRQENNETWTRTKSVYHPSALAGCKRAIYYDRVGEDPKQRIPPDKRMLFDLGHAIHDLLQGKLAKIEGFESEVRVNYDPLDIVGHCDGVFSKQGWVLEIKTVGDSTFKSLLSPKKEHIQQVHCYMKALDIPRAQLLYVNRNNGYMRMFRVNFANVVWEGIEDTINYIENCIEKETVPEREESYFSCGICKFHHICGPENWS